MVDLFGKKKLEDRILELQTELAKLEGEKEDLFRTLEKREEKIRRLSCANQEANLALKVAEQRVVALVLLRRHRSRGVRRKRSRQES